MKHYHLTHSVTGLRYMDPNSQNGGVNGQSAMHSTMAASLLGHSPTHITVTLSDHPFDSSTCITVITKYRDNTITVLIKGIAYYVAHEWLVHKLRELNNTAFIRIRTRTP